MRITRILLLLLFLVSIQNSFSQTNIDAKIEHYFNHFQFDSAYVLIQKNYKKTKINTEKNAEYSIQGGFKTLMQQGQ
jgi:hypothetical protein